MAHLVEQFLNIVRHFHNQSTYVSRGMRIRMMINNETNQLGVLGTYCWTIPNIYRFTDEFWVTREGDPRIHRYCWVCL